MRPDSNSVFFYYDSDLRKYRCSFYEEDMTDYQLTKSEVTNFFSKLPLTPDESSSSKNYVRFFRLSTIIALTVLGFSALMIVYGYNNPSDKYIGQIGFVILFVDIWVLLQQILKFFDTKKGFIQKTRDRISNYIRKQRASFRNRGLVWQVPEGHYSWIELKVLRDENEYRMLSFQGTRGSIQSAYSSESLSPTLSSAILQVPLM